MEDLFCLIIFENYPDNSQSAWQNWRINSQNALQPVDVHAGSLNGQKMVILTSTNFGSQFSKNWELFNQDPINNSKKLEILENLYLFFHLCPQDAQFWATNARRQENAQPIDYLFSKRGNYDDMFVILQNVEWNR
jgi:hypothetical protein